MLRSILLTLIASLLMAVIAPHAHASDSYSVVLPSEPDILKYYVDSDMRVVGIRQLGEQSDELTFLRPGSYRGNQIVELMVFPTSGDPDSNLTDAGVRPGGPPFRAC